MLVSLLFAGIVGIMFEVTALQQLVGREKFHSQWRLEPIDLDGLIGFTLERLAIVTNTHGDSPESPNFRSNRQSGLLRG